MELEFEHIDWDDIVEAELSGDQETLTKLRSVTTRRALSKKARFD